MLLALGSLGLSACGLQVGRAPVVVEGVSLGEIESGAPEPRLQEDLGRALARELSRRTRVGAGPAVSAEVLATRVAPVSDGGTTWQAHLRVRYRLDTEPPVQMEVSGDRIFVGTPSSWDATSAARCDALASLAEQLTAEAVPVLLSSSPGGMP